MRDILVCPICNNIFRTIRKTEMHLHFIDKSSKYIERVCAGLNHCVQIFVDSKTKEIDLLKLSLSHTYDRFIELDFVNKKSKIIFLKDGIPKYLLIPKLIEPDFPNLIEMKEIIALYAIMI